MYKYSQNVSPTFEKSVFKNIDSCLWDHPVCTSQINQVCDTVQSNYLLCSRQIRNRYVIIMRKTDYLFYLTRSHERVDKSHRSVLRNGRLVALVNYEMLRVLYCYDISSFTYSHACTSIAMNIKLNIQFLTKQYSCRDCQRPNIDAEQTQRRITKIN